MDSRHTVTDTASRGEILTRLLDEDEASLRRLAASHSDRQEDAEDAFADACEKFLCHFRGATMEQARSFLNVVIKRRAWDELARRSRQSAIAQSGRRDIEEAASDIEGWADPSRGPEELALAYESNRSFELAFACLKTDEKRALLLIGLGFTYREIEEATRWSPTKIKRLVYEGRVRLRESVERGGKV